MAQSFEMRFSGWGVDADAGELSPHVVDWLDYLGTLRVG